MFDIKTSIQKDELINKLFGEITETELTCLKGILKAEIVALQNTKDNSSLAYALALAYIDQKLHDIHTNKPCLVVKS